MAAEDVERLSERLRAHWHEAEGGTPAEELLDDWLDLLEDAREVVGAERERAIDHSVERILADIILQLAEDHDEEVTLGRSIGVVIRAAVQGHQQELQPPGGERICWYDED